MWRTSRMSSTWRSLPGKTQDRCRSSWRGRVDFFDPIAERYGLQLEVVNHVVDPTFSFMTVDNDGRIRMDCSSPYAMASLIELKDNFDIAFGNDTDADRHGIVTKSVGLLNPNHYLSVAVNYLFQNRPGWRKDSAIGKPSSPHP